MRRMFRTPPRHPSPAELKPHTCVFFQDRSRMYDSLNMHSLESSLIDIMRAEQDPMKSKASFPFSARVDGRGRWDGGGRGGA